ncbi:M24 family metallopeptidase [Evansella tamaricis]|uniref:Xaa-Pro peptidase family protein n=1 Tax=Evansella tamaricis TaxID=2069301 RepID=A0ABS6JGY7_9BACI|nr:Xaa-Pro peptidase family protein [Evansella tamaricis]
MEQRIEAIRQWMNGSNIDVLMCQTRANVFYYSGFDTDPHERIVAIFILKDRDPFFICPHMEVNQVKPIFTNGEIIGYSDTDNPWEKIKDAFHTRELAPRKIAVESSLSWDRVKNLINLFPSADLVEGDDAILSKRIIKSEKEIALLREAAKFADLGIEIGIESLEEGISEMEVLAKIEYELKKAGVREMSFSTMVLFGEKGGDPHGKPGNRLLRKGDSVLFDLGVVWKGYCSDITRTVFFDHVTEREQTIYEAVLEAEEASLKKCKPGNAISTLDNTARNILEKKGFGEYFPHRIGHGLGIEVHEYPSLNAKNDSPLMPGMTFTIEPGVYIPNQVGVRIEDDVLITESGYETLTKFPKVLTIVPEKN